MLLNVCPSRKEPVLFLKSSTWQYCTYMFFWFNICSVFLLFWSRWKKKKRVTERVLISHLNLVFWFSTNRFGKLFLSFFVIRKVVLRLLQPLLHHCQFRHLHLLLQHYQQSQNASTGMNFQMNLFRCTRSLAHFCFFFFFIKYLCIELHKIDNSCSWFKVSISRYPPNAAREEALQFSSHTFSRSCKKTSRYCGCFSFTSWKIVYVLRVLYACLYIYVRFMSTEMA